MARAKISTNTHGPAIRGVDPWAPSAGKMRQLLSEEERARLAVLASIVRFNKGEEIYRKGQRADAIFNIITGVVKTYQTAPDGSEHIAGFLFPDDMFGLAEEGRYTNSAKAITPLAVYRFPVSALRSRLARDADLEFHVICKLIHELRADRDLAVGYRLPHPREARHAARAHRSITLPASTNCSSCSL